MTADEIASKYSGIHEGITIKRLDRDEKDPIVLIEGGRESLKMLSELISAVSDGKPQEGFSMSPKGAGKIHFTDDSEFGIYINLIKT